MRHELEVTRCVMSPVRELDDRIVLPHHVLAAIKARIYFLWGEEDPFGGPDIAREFVKHISNSDLELLPGTGYAVWVDHPDHATKIVESFFRD